MLDQTTKRRIDSARQILVGKVPDPKQQVDQITNALIYKFMDDMDKESQELGGKAGFFTNGFEKYSWAKLLDKRLSGQERRDLFEQAISNMSKNRHIPQLFRDVFKDAFLPYRDPETLTLFLKEINGFTYDHSEDLGNAFEYLLSVLGSQGDAGQFRTPRHIIDFIAEIVDPKKNETVLDPACGTAGFLISAYKHILRNHDARDNKTGKPTNKEKHLTPDERKKLMNNFVGYDIGPDMVKLSLVNMYLHGFQEPKIYEYDTLTSEKHWGEQFDVIMANPPFMSPKGGIRPHKRFSVQAKRSEVLFVDYIMEHLNLKGRAGIIVPEGIIFKNDKAYKKLRQLLIEDGLFAVVSLPSGVFKPYSGVKTSILFFDNQLAKKSDEVLFLKIENDGFDLGDQRRKIDKNDMPEALEILEAWKKGRKQKADIALWVKKKKIAESGDYNLIGDRYREVAAQKNQKWPLVELGEVLKYEQPTKYIVESVNYDNSYKTPVLTAGKTFILGYTNETNGVFPADKLPVIIFDDFTTAIKFVDFAFKVKSSAMKILHPNKVKAHPVFLFYFMRTIKFRHDEHKRYWISEYSKTKIPRPPLEVQKEIVKQIEVKQNAINAAREVIKNLERERRYFGQELRKLEDVEWVELGDVCVIGDGNHSSNYPKASEMTDQGVPFIRASNIQKLEIIDNDMRYISEDKHGKLKKGHLKANDVLFSNRGEIGKVALIPAKFDGANLNSQVAWLRAGNGLFPKYLLYVLNSEITQSKLQTEKGGATLQQYTIKQIKSLQIPLPSLKIQKQLIAEVEREEEIIVANRRLIKLMERKINQVLSDV